MTPRGAVCFHRHIVIIQMDETRLATILIGIGCGIVITLLILLCMYCIRRRLVHRGVISNVDSITLSRDQQRMYLAKRQKIRMKRYSHQRKIRMELAAIPKTQNPLVYNEREVDLAVPGPAAKPEASVATPVDATT